MSLLERIISKQIEFFFVVGGSCLFHHVALDVLFENFRSLLNVLTDHTSRCARIATCSMAHAEIEFEALRDGCFEGGNAVQEVHRFSPRCGVGVVDERLSIEHQRKRQDEVVVVAL